MKIKLLFIGLVLINLGIVCSSADLQLQTAESLVSYAQPKCSAKSFSTGVVVGWLSAYALDDVLKLNNEEKIWYLFSGEFRAITGQFNAEIDTNGRKKAFQKYCIQTRIFKKNHKTLTKASSLIEKYACFVEALAFGLFAERYSRTFFVKKGAYLTNSVFALQKAMISLAIMASLQDKNDKKIQHCCEKVLIACKQILLLDDFKTYKEQIDAIEVDVNNIKNGKTLSQGSVLSLIPFLMGSLSKRWFGIMCLLQRKELVQQIADQIATDSSKWYNFAESKYLKWYKNCEADIKKYELMSL